MTIYQSNQPHPWQISFPTLDENGKRTFIRTTFNSENGFTPAGTWSVPFSNNDYFALWRAFPMLYIVSLWSKLSGTYAQYEPTSAVSASGSGTITVNRVS